MIKGGIILPFDGKYPTIGENACIAPTATIIGDVTIGANTNIWFNVVIRGDISPIVIGENVNIQDNCVIHTMQGKPLTIGENVQIGHGTMIHSDSIGSNTLIGMGSNLLGHTQIGENCIIGAGTIITQHKKIPPNCLVYGNPAKLVRSIRDDEMQAMAGSLERHIELAKKYRDQFEDYKL